MSVTLLLLATGNAAEINASPHRKVENGIGNCVFSRKELPFKKDATFAGLTTQFEGPGPVYARCYYPKTVGEYRNEGKLRSQIRGDAMNKPSINRRLQFATPVWYYQHTVDAGPKNLHRDQAYLWLTPSGQCDMRKKPRTGECVNIEAEVRKMAEKEGASLPFTTQVCMHIDFDVVNEKIPNPDNVLEQIDKKQFVTIAKGCFDYTVK